MSDDGRDYCEQIATVAGRTGNEPGLRMAICGASVPRVMQSFTRISVLHDLGWHLAGDRHWHVVMFHQAMATACWVLSFLLLTRRRLPASAPMPDQGIIPTFTSKSTRSIWTIRQSERQGRARF